MGFYVQLGVAILFAWPIVAMSHGANDHSHEARSHDSHSHGAHQHGVGTAGLVLDGQQFFIELSVPAMDIFGLEKPSNDAKVLAAIASKAKYFEQGQWLQLSSEASCQLSEAAVFSNLVPKAGQDQIQQDAAAVTQQLFQGGQFGLAESSNSSQNNSADSHQDVIISASYVCQAPTKLAQVSFALWPQTPSLQKINAQWVHPNGQGAIELTPNMPTVQF